MYTNFQRIFKVEILHSYFEKDICTCLEFQPTLATEAVFKRFGFVINERMNGFSFYSTATVSLRDSLEHVRGVTGLNYFEFDLFCNSEAFYGFTALPVNWTGKLLYDSADVTLNEQTLLLNETLSEPETGGIGGNLKVRFDDLIQYDAGKQFLNFQISLAARATQWNYYVVNRNAVPLENAAVKSKDGIVFENNGTVTIASGENAVLFSSGGQLIPLSKFPKHKFDLVNMLQPENNSSSAKNNFSKTIIKGLPTPDPLMMGVTKVNDKTQVSSPIYIYV